MSDWNKSEGLKKIKYYDLAFLSIIILFIVSVLCIFLSQFDVLFDIMSLIFAGCLILALPGIGLISIGMTYHQFKTKNYIFITITIISILFGLIFINNTLFYWIKMRKEFKKGNGIYS